MRTESKHNVSVIDFTQLAIAYSDCLLKENIITKFNKIRTFTYGIVEKSGEHYLITNDGVGSAVSLERERGEIAWFKEEYNEDGTEKSFDCSPFRISEFYYLELMAVTSIKEIVSLDKFVRGFGSRLDENFENWDKFLSGQLVPVYDE